MPPADAGFGHDRARRHAADREERDRGHEQKEAGIGHDPPLQAEPRDQELCRRGGGKGADQRDLREPVAHPIEKRAVGGRAHECRPPRQLRNLVEAVARIKEHHHHEERREGQPVADGHQREQQQRQRHDRQQHPAPVRAEPGAHAVDHIADQRVDDAIPDRREREEQPDQRHRNHAALRDVGRQVDAEWQAEHHRRPCRRGVGGNRPRAQRRGFVGAGGRRQGSTGQGAMLPKQEPARFQLLTAMSTDRRWAALADIEMGQERLEPPVDFFRVEPFVLDPHQRAQHRIADDDIEK